MVKCGTEKNKVSQNYSNKIANGGVIAAAMVVGIHCSDSLDVGSVLWWWDRLVTEGLFMVAVPFFFVCSGYFLCRHYESGNYLVTWHGELRKRFKSLLVPYLIWSLIGVCVINLLPVAIATNIAHGQPLMRNIPVGHEFWLTVFGLNPYSYPLVYQLWYVRALLLFTVLSPVLHVLVKRWGVAACFVFYLLWAVWGTGKFGGYCAHPFFFYCFSLSGLFFFSVGCLLACKNVRIARIGAVMQRWPVVISLSGCCLLVLSAYLWQQTGSEIVHLKLLVAPLLLVAFWRAIPSAHWPEWLVKSAFPVYLIHVILWYGIVRCCSLVHQTQPTFWMHVDTIAEWWIKWIIGFGGSLAITLVLRKIMPRWASVLFGGR